MQKTCKEKAINRVSCLCSSGSMNGRGKGLWKGHCLITSGAPDTRQTSRKSCSPQTGHCLSVLSCQPCREKSSSVEHGSKHLDMSVLLSIITCKWTNLSFERNNFLFLNSQWTWSSGKKHYFWNALPRPTQNTIVFKSLRLIFFMFLKEDSYDHQDCIYLII